MRTIQSLFLIYRPQGVLIALWTVFRLFILPYKKIDAIVPLSGTILDIGCGTGGLTNYLSDSSPNRNMLGIDLSKNRVSVAVKSVKRRRNIKFIVGDANTTKLPRVDCYIMVDVLHHIPFYDQERLLQHLSQHMKNNSILIIKDVDPSNRIPFFFGHIIEKILYPKEKIYARSKKDWERLFRSLKFSVKIFPGVFYFPDSTQIFVSRPIKRLAQEK